MRALLRWALPVLLAANGLFMLLAPHAWYPAVPGVTETGPYNPHFVRDIGAAYLAGLASGFWSSQEEIAQQWQVERTFEPRMTADQRDSLYAGWQRAVERAKGWESDKV